MVINQELEPGVKIEIQRSDKRIHPAVVATVDDISKTITVEWYENGQTKGKEISFHSVFTLNPHLVSRGSLTNGGTRASTPIKKGNIRRGSLQHENSAESISQDYPKAKRKHSESQSAPPSERWIPLPFIENIPLLKNIPSNEKLSAAQVKLPWERGKAAEEIEKIKKKREERRRKAAQKQEALEALIKAEKGNPNWLENCMIKEFRQKLEFKPLNMTDAVEDRALTVCVRKRPLSLKDKQLKVIDILTVPQKDIIIVHEPKMKVDLTKYLDNQTFRFDYAFDEFCPNEMVYHFTAAPLVRTIFQKGRATCFAYGQTGSGKTHTMSGSFRGKSQQDLSKGIYALTAADVFKMVALPEYRTLNLTVNACYFEIYRGKVFDLLDRRTQLNVFEDKNQQVQIQGLTELTIESAGEVMKLIKIGNRERSSGRTSANINSSRSHAVFQIILKERKSGSVYGKFSLIDLAGNERGKDTNTVNRLRSMEGGEINKSLLALKECIRALGRRGSHLPFRTSKLTQVLKESFIGENSKTCMIAMVCPGMSSCEHTLNTLHYANRVKELDSNEIQEKFITPKVISEDDDLEEERIESSESEEIEGSTLTKSKTLMKQYNTWRECCNRCDSMEAELFSSNSDKKFARNEYFLQELDLILKTRLEQLLIFQKQIVNLNEIILKDFSRKKDL